jgi:two-component system sensor histidine kinase KdpD
MGGTEDQRPDPDALLAAIQADAASEAAAETRRGRLRVYFGASAGVGKTYAMLAAARRLAEDGVDVVVGVVETHGRAETEALLQGLAVLPRRRFDVRGVVLQEFDLDTALARAPSLLLVDELAHTNAPGSRHPKRWQDVEELLDAGIDVFSTLNVQHLESLNDVVAGITGIPVAETIPDRFFDRADEVVLVDLAAEELLARLHAGKVYLPEQAERARQNFFRKGNLIALRELALRRTAERVEEDVQAYREAKAIAPVWKTAASLMVTVGPHPGGEQVVRSGARLAQQLNAEWFAVYAETPALQRLPEAERQRVLARLRLAESLGGRSAVVACTDAAEGLAQFARRNNVSRVVIGRRELRGWPFFQTLSVRLARRLPDADIFFVARTEVPGKGAREAQPATGPSDGSARSFDGVGYGAAAAICGVLTLLLLPLRPRLDTANIVMMYLLATVVAALRLGRGPAVLAALLGVGLFDFFFIPPYYSLAVNEPKHLVTFAVMLAAGLLVGQLTAGLRYSARVSQHREERARVLFEFARDLSSQLELEPIVQRAQAVVAATFQSQVAVLLPDADGRLSVPPQALDDIDLGAAQWCFDRFAPAGMYTDTLAGSKCLYLPLRAPMRVRGVLVLKPHSRRLLQIPEMRQQLDTFASLIGISLERVHYVEVARQAAMTIETERLRNTVLSSLSHDLRTPVAALIGLAESLLLPPLALSPAQSETARALVEQARRISRMLENLLEMARLSAGATRMNLGWNALEETFGTALAGLESVLAGHTVQIDLPADLPLVEYDALLMERVFANLLENAAKYTPPGSRIRIEARAQPQQLTIQVCDNGPGLPPGREQAVFEAFERGSREDARPGVGLGLALARAIVQAHQGTLAAEPAPGGGACFRITLPRREAPQAPDEASLPEPAAHFSDSPAPVGEMARGDNLPSPLGERGRG